MAKRGIFRRLVDFVTGRKPTPKPVAPPISVPPVLRTERQRVVDKILSLSPLAFEPRVKRNVSHMTDAELRWAMQATEIELRNRARINADRLITLPGGGIIPLNPFWYK